MWSVRRLSAVVVCLATTVASAAAEDKMPWQPNLEAAQQLAGRTNRLVLIHFWAPWCQPCMRLEREVFSQAETCARLGSELRAGQAELGRSAGHDSDVWRLELADRRHYPAQRAARVTIPKPADG